MESGNFQNGFRWWIYFYGLLGLDQKGYLCKKNHLLHILDGAAGFRLYDLAILKIWESHLYYEMDFKNFRNPKMILKIFVNPISFCNGFQKIEVQVIRFYLIKRDFLRVLKFDSLYF